MKIANENGLKEPAAFSVRPHKRRLVALPLFFLLPLLSVSVWAGQAYSADPTPPLAVTNPASPQPIAAPPPPVLLNSQPAVPFLVGALDPTKAAAGTEGIKNAPALEEKVTESAKKLISTIETSSTPLSMADLNAARQTVARIDAVIEIEKHLAELEKLRGHDSHIPSSFSAAIPASALMPMPSAPSAPAAPMAIPQPITPVSPPKKESALSAELVRVVGADGAYIAVLRLTSGSTKTFKVGDSVGDHGRINRITPTAVVLTEAGRTHTLSIGATGPLYSAAYQ